VDEVPVASVSAFDDALGVDGYLSLNARVAWRPYPDLELSVAGQNLLDERHLEFVGEAFVAPTEVERSVYGQVRWEF
jgi:iron complex outermembrane receptor protein